MLFCTILSSFVLVWHLQSSVAFVQTHAGCSGALWVQSQLSAADFGSCRSMVHSRSAASTVLSIARGHAHYLHTMDLITTCNALLSNGSIGYTHALHISSMNLCPTLTVIDLLASSATIKPEWQCRPSALVASHLPARQCGSSRDSPHQLSGGPGRLHWPLPYWFPSR